ncbi:MAG TPA: thermonuclease family protein [Burkholderiaceae bacterium]|nr:thermonuclease family protein [Burkholderiaceae bacterium]
MKTPSASLSGPGKRIAVMLAAFVFLLGGLVGTVNGFEVAMAGNPDPAATAEDKITTLQCQVASVHDGDSMRARCPGFKKTLRIRLEQIDAPETDQAYGIRARDHLRSLCKRGGPVTIHNKGTDTYNRILGRVYCQGMDVNAAMVADGLAWFYEYYGDDPELKRLHNQAVAERKGLWASRKRPQAPWDFRYQQKKQRQR